MKTIVMWHGGRNLEYNFKESQSAKGLWEHGPGLYLTTSYERARQYAKGGGATYSVTVEDGSDIDKVLIPIEKLTQFISENIIKSKRNELLDDVHSNMKRMNSISHIKSDFFLNLIINLNALKKSNTAKLAEFLVENGADFGFTKNYGGSDETVMVVYNRDKIKSVVKVAAKDVLLKDYSLECNFIDFKKIIKP